MQSDLAAIDPKYKAMLMRRSNRPDDGNFGDDTKAAVIQFQKDHGLKPTGQVDDELRAAIRQAAFEKTPVPHEVAMQQAQRYMENALDRARQQAMQVPKWDSYVGPKEDIGSKIVRFAEKELGNCEVGGENRGPHVERYRSASGNSAVGSPWCADFVSYVMNEATPGLIKPSAMAASVSSQFKKAGAYHQEGTYTPQKGDLVVFESYDKTRGKHVGHVGIVTGVDKDGTIHTIEGNVAHQKYDGQKEAGAWTKEAPDLVRRREWKPGEEQFGNRIVGFGSAQEMARAKGLDRDLGQSTDFAQAHRPQRPSRQV